MEYITQLSNAPKTQIKLHNFENSSKIIRIDQNFTEQNEGFFSSRYPSNIHQTVKSHSRENICWNCSTSLIRRRRSQPFCDATCQLSFRIKKKLSARNLTILIDQELMNDTTSSEISNEDIECWDDYEMVPQIEEKQES